MYFDGIKVKDKIWTMLYGWCIVDRIQMDYTYSIRFKPLEGVYDDDFTDTCNMDGYINVNHKNQTVFWDEVKFEQPKKPVSYEDCEKQVKNKPFNTLDYNYFVIYDTRECDWVIQDTKTFCAYNMKYYTIEEAKKLINLLNENEVKIIV